MSSPKRFSAMRSNSRSRSSHEGAKIELSYCTGYCYLTFFIYPFLLRTSPQRRFISPAVFIDTDGYGEMPVGYRKSAATPFWDSKFALCLKASFIRLKLLALTLWPKLLWGSTGSLMLTLSKAKLFSGIGVMLVKFARIRRRNLMFSRKFGVITYFSTFLALFRPPLSAFTTGITPQIVTSCLPQSKDEKYSMNTRKTSSGSIVHVPIWQFMMYSVITSSA